MYMKGPVILGYFKQNYDVLLLPLGASVNRLDIMYVCMYVCM